MSEKDTLSELAELVGLGAWHICRGILHGLLLLLHIHPGEHRAGNQNARAVRNSRVRAPWE